MFRAGLNKTSERRWKNYCDCVGNPGVIWDNLQGLPLRFPIWNENGQALQYIRAIGYWKNGWAMPTILFPTFCLHHLKRTLLGAHHMVSKKYIQNYLDEFCYKVSRRYFGDELFDRLLIACVTINYKDIVKDYR